MKQQPKTIQKARQQAAERQISRDEPAAPLRADAAPAGTPAAASAQEAPSPASQPAATQTGGGLPATVTAAGEPLPLNPMAARIEAAMAGAKPGGLAGILGGPKHVHAWDKKG